MSLERKLEQDVKQDTTDFYNNKHSFILNPFQGRILIWPIWEGCVGSSYISRMLQAGSKGFHQQTLSKSRWQMSSIFRCKDRYLKISKLHKFKAMQQTFNISLNQWYWKPLKTLLKVCYVPATSAGLIAFFSSFFATAINSSNKANKAAGMHH
jgi:hypothetical protein